MLSDFKKLQKGLTSIHKLKIIVSNKCIIELGDWLIQNGATSAVGQSVIQLSKSLGLHTVNLIRGDRPDLPSTVASLEALGASLVVTEETVRKPETARRIRDALNGKSINLGLNCVGGKSFTNLARLMG
jgi:mitochondrial enoyl-[acyl-carrier protein] reductase / trans-2-enoyl-CoA reductase